MNKSILCSKLIGNAISKKCYGRPVISSSYPKCSSSSLVIHPGAVSQLLKLIVQQLLVRTVKNVVRSLVGYNRINLVQTIKRRESDSVRNRRWSHATQISAGPPTFVSQWSDGQPKYFGQSGQFYSTEHPKQAKFFKIYWGRIWHDHSNRLKSLV